MKSKNPYAFFNQFCLRTPLLALDFYDDLTSEKKITKAKFREIWKNATIKEALFLASPELFTVVEKWLGGVALSDEKIQKLRCSILKYLSRMASRCTPFGLFAGCSIGEFGDATNIILKSSVYHKRQTRFDMNFLVALSQKLSKEKPIKTQLLWYPNTSLYKIGKQYRYVEYTYNRYNKREHTIEAVAHTPYLEKILTHARTGKKITALAKLLVDPVITEEEAEVFIETLIENQILVSELEPSVTGEDFLTQVKQGLKKLQNTKAITDEIAAFQDAMEALDKQLGNTVQQYKDIRTAIEKLDTAFDLKYLFQTDLYTETIKNELNIRWAYKIRRAMTLLNKMSPPPQHTNLQHFKNAFIKRYETREMPLATVLDTETGIGYLQDQEAIDSTPFLDDIDIPVKYSPQHQLPWDAVQDILYKKLEKTTADNSYTLQVFDRDFEALEAQWNDLPDTMAAMIELVIDNHEEKVVLPSIGGTSGANLLGRFSTGSPEMLKHVQHIVAVEQEMNPNVLLAEIVHLPESRTGNVIRRATLRDYEIPYLGKSQLPPIQQLPIEDLMISVRNNTVILRSKKHNKQIIPRLTNAHNYSANALPVYHFLCDMQRQHMRSAIRFSWGIVQERNRFLPRVVYSDFILSKARWKISKEELTFLSNADEDMLEKVAEWRLERKMPKWVQWIDGDRTLLIHLEQEDSIRMWLDAVKNRRFFILEEFLFTGEGIVKHGTYRYTNQFVIAFYNAEKLDNAKAKSV